VASLESSIDRLYQGPLDEFVAARTALAKTLSGDDAKRVKALAKPAAAAWAVNQLYWHARGVYDRLIKSGGALRAAQVAALAGRKADVRGAAEAHRKVLSESVREALRLASAAGVNPNQDAVTQTFEALSLAASATETAGRLTKPLQPAGFEALAGVAIKDPGPKETSGEKARQDKKAVEAAAAERERQEEIKTAQAALEQARRAEARARSEWESRKHDLEQAERTLASLEKT
jgi:hypothetical protein